MTAWIVALGGAAGAGHAALIARAAQSPSHPISTLARLFLAGTVLLATARAGHLGLGAAAWMIGFASTVLLALRRSW